MHRTQSDLNMVNTGVMNKPNSKNIQGSVNTHHALLMMNFSYFHEKKN